MTFTYGHCAPSIPHRGAHEEPSPCQIDRMPARVSMREIRPPALNQGNIGSCCADAVVSATALLGRRQGLLWEDSSLALYYAVRRRMGDVATDSGCTLAQAILTAQEFGLYPLENWPHDPRLFNPEEIPDDFEARSSLRRVINWGPLAHDLTTLRWTLYCGYPLLFGVVAGDAFEKGEAWATGRVEEPSRSLFRSGHAVLSLGYNDISRHFEILNPWGPTWGNVGLGKIPYSYILNPALCTEIQTIRAVRCALVEVDP